MNTEKLATEYYLERNKNVYHCTYLPMSLAKMTQEQFDAAAANPNDGCLMNMEQYLARHYQGECYQYSTTGLMGLPNDAVLMRGRFTRQGDKPDDYKHGWNEFEFEKKKYVACNLNGVVLLKDYYTHFKPEQIWHDTRESILDAWVAGGFFEQSGDPWIVNGKGFENHEWNGRGNKRHVQLGPHSLFYKKPNSNEKYDFARVVLLEDCGC